MVEREKEGADGVSPRAFLPTQMTGFTIRKVLIRRVRGLARILLVLRLSAQRRDCYAAFLPSSRRRLLQLLQVALSFRDRRAIKTWRCVRG